VAAPEKRRDYASNARKSYDKKSGCGWCGREGFGRIPLQSEYCSDACLQADMEGIDDLLPAMTLQPGNSGNSEYVARKFTQYNETYGNRIPKGTGRDDKPGEVSG
jgi:hypothetical protein